MPLLGWSAPEEEIAAQIHVRAKSQIAQPRVLGLEEIAEISGLDAGDINILSNLEFRPKFKKGQGIISKKALIQQLRPVLSQLSTRPQLIMPDQVAIQLKGQSIDTDWAERVIGEGVRQNCPDCEFQIMNLKFPEVQVTQLDAFKLIIRNFRGGTFNWPVEIQDGKKSKVITLRGYLKLYRYGPVSRRLLRPGDRLRDTDFQVERIDVTHIFKPIADASEVLNEKLRRSIMSGQPIYQDDLLRQRLLTEGEPVRVEFSRGSLSVFSPGLALSSGDMGDVVKVKIDRNQKVLTATVTDKGVVKIQ